MRSWAAVLVGAALAVASWAGAQGIAFTVQVIAVSDQAAALELTTDLLRQGFPAYVVRSTGGQGTVYRVRVGAFANRSAAVRYAAAMPDVAGSRPIPALAEDIPQGVMPWAPRVLWQGPFEDVEVRVAPWPGEGMALRLQTLDPLAQAQVLLVQAGEVRHLAAWRVAPLAVRPPARAEAQLAGPAGASDAAADGAAPEPGPPAEANGADPYRGEAEPKGEGPAVTPIDGPPEAALWLLRDRPLWPATWREDSDEVRAAFAASTLQLVAAGAGLPVAALEPASTRRGDEPPPILVVVEVTDRNGRDAGDVRAVGDAGAALDASGPQPLPGSDPLWWPPAALGDVVDVAAPAAGPFATPQGVLTADAPFVRLAGDSDVGWRVVAGTPLWSDGRHLLLRDGAELVLVDFQPR